MNLKQFKARIDGDKYGVVRRFPEVGADEQFGAVMDVVVAGKRLAIIFGNDEESGPGPYRVREIRVGEFIDLGDAVVIGEAVDWPVTTWLFSRQRGRAADVWDDRHADYHDFEDVALAQAVQQLSVPLLQKPPPVQRFEFVRWSVMIGGDPSPAGVVMRREDGAGLGVEEFPGHEAAADFWGSRYTFVPKEFLADINHASGRAEMFSPPETVQAPSFEEALDRAKYRFAKEHYTETGRTLY